jgi:DNA-binding beta-propeller fold protein YncE
MHRSAVSTVALLAQLALLAPEAWAAPLAYVTRQPEDAPSRITELTGRRSYRRLKPVTDFAVGTRPGLTAISPDGAMLYVVDLGVSLSVVDTGSRAVVDALPLELAGAVALSPDGSTAYVTVFTGIAVVDTATLTVVTEIPLPDAAQVAVDAGGARLYAIDFPAPASEPSTVVAIDTASNAIVDSVSLEPHHGAGLALHPDGARLFVTGYGPASPPVTVLDTATLDVLTTIPIAGSNAVAIHPAGTQVYVLAACTDPVCTGPGVVSIVDPATYAVVDTVEVGHLAVDIDVTPDGKYVYVTNYRDDFVSVFSAKCRVGRARGRSIGPGGSSLVFASCPTCSVSSKPCPPGA